MHNQTWSGKLRFDIVAAQLPQHLGINLAHTRVGASQCAGCRTMHAIDIKNNNRAFGKINNINFSLCCQYAALFSANL